MSYYRRAIRKPVEHFTGNNKMYCKTNGCGKCLTPMEYLYSEYCFSCNANLNQMERAKRKLTDGFIYKYIRYKWNANLNRWDQEFSGVITIDQYSAIHKRDDFKRDSSELFYRYDLYIDSLSTDIVYTYNPNLFL